MQEALGGKAIHAALRSLTSICSGLLGCGQSPCFRYNVRFGALADAITEAAARGGLYTGAVVREAMRSF
jgi:hypothetical protein